MSLKKAAVSSLIWTFSEQFGTRLISFVISMFLARLLQPSDFGLIAIFGVVMNVAGTFIDGGLAKSLVRTPNTDDKDYSTVFIFNVVMSFLLYMILFFTAPYLSDFYDIQKLTPIIRVYGINLIIGSFVTVQSILFVKDLNFKTAFKIKLPSLLISGAVGVFLAYNGYGVWSLVYSAIVQTLIFMLQHWFYSPWRPSLAFDKERFKYHFKFGFKMSVSGLLDTIFNNIYTIIIGKYFSVQEVGYYNRADTLKQLPVNNISVALNKVSFPLFAKISHDNVKLKDVYRKMMGVVIFVIAPILAIMVVVAEPLIRFLLTEKWLPAVPYFQILAIAGLLYPIHSYNLNILLVKGRSDLFLKLEIGKKILVVFIVLISLYFGIYGLLWGQVVLSIMALFINTYYTGKLLNYRTINQLKDLLPCIVLAFILAVFFYFIDKSFLIKFSDIARLTILSPIYFILYLGISYLCSFKEVKFIIDLLKK